MGLGQDVPERLYGVAVVRHIGVDQVTGRGLVQAAHAGRRRVLQRARARGRSRLGRAQEPNAGKCRRRRHRRPRTIRVKPFWFAPSPHIGLTVKSRTECRRLILSMQL